MRHTLGSEGRAFVRGAEPRRTLREAGRAAGAEPLENRVLFATTTINFDTDGLGANTSPGQFIDNEYANLGVTVSSDPANRAMIFDSANPTGGDPDLGTPNETFGGGGPGVGEGGEIGEPGQNGVAEGRVLIISEDLRAGDPDDRAAGGTILFTFANPVTFGSIKVLDIENNVSEVRRYDAGDNLIGTTPLQRLGDNSAQTLAINQAGVSRVEVFFGGSGAIPFITFDTDQPPPPPPPTGDEGLTPGFWKNHTSLWQDFAPGQTMGSVFDVPNSLGLGSKTLLQALQFGGGPGVVGAAKNLLRHAVAALLNASHDLVEFPLTVNQVIDQVNDALASGDKDEIEDLKDELEDFNQLGGGIDAHGNPI